MVTGRVGWSGLGLVSSNSSRTLTPFLALTHLHDQLGIVSVTELAQAQDDPWRLLGVASRQGNFCSLNLSRPPVTKIPAGYSRNHASAAAFLGWHPAGLGLKFRDSHTSLAHTYTFGGIADDHISYAIHNSKKRDRNCGKDKHLILCLG